MKRQGREMPSARRAIVATIATTGVLAAGACSDDGGGSADEFCGVWEELAGNIKAFEDGEISESEGRDLFAKMADVEPPDEIAQDYEKFVEFFSFENESEDERSDQVEGLLPAAQRVNTYLEDECGLTEN